MTFSCDGHTHLVFLAVVDRILVVDAAAGVGDGHDAGLVDYYWILSLLFFAKGRNYVYRLLFMVSTVMMVA